MNIQQIEETAETLKSQVGGTIFAFPIDDRDPFSKYAVTMYTGEEYKTFPDTLVFEEAADGVAQLLEGLKENGFDADYERNVRFVSYEAQVNAPSVTMRRLKKGPYLQRTGYLNEGVDIVPTDDGYDISARGLIKFSYLQMIDDKTPKAALFMDEYYKLLAMRKYGKTAAAIKQEVRRMDKDEAVKWIERSYTKYIHDDMEVMNIMQTIKGGS